MGSYNNRRYEISINDVTLDGDKYTIIETDILNPPIPRYIDESIEGRDGIIKLFDSFDNVENSMTIMVKPNDKSNHIDEYMSDFHELLYKYPEYFTVTLKQYKKYDNNFEEQLSCFKECYITNIEPELIADDTMLLYLDFESEPFWNGIKYTVSQNFRNEGMDTNDYIIRVRTDANGGRITLGNRSFRITTHGRTILLHGKNGLITDDRGQFITDTLFEGDLPTIRRGSNGVVTSGSIDNFSIEFREKFIYPPF